MANPLLLLASRAHRPGPSTLRRKRVGVPQNVSSIDAVFLVLQRMRGPLLAVLVVLTISVVGLTVIPGVDDAGNPYTLTAFEAFYVMSYTATTIGFGEVPYSFTTAQRLWMTVCIYASVTVWAYSIGALFGLLQDPAFRHARERQKFRRKVARISEPFLIVCGYGQTGREVCRALDDLGRAFVVIDGQRSRLDVLATDQLMRDVPALEADVRDPAMLGLAGMGDRRCQGIVVVTDDDDANLAVVMAGHLLRPELQIVVRAGSREHAEYMADFEPDAIVNPDDHYGAFLVLALERPVVSRLVDWIMAPRGAPMPPSREGLKEGRWAVLADGRFGEEVSRDLESTGLDVTLAHSEEGCPDLHGIAGFVAGSSQDATNLAYAARARLESPEAFISIRQGSTVNASLLEAFKPESIYVPTDLVAREMLARVVTPLTWQFVEHALQQDDAWGAEVLNTILERSGEISPSTDRLVVDSRQAPAVVRWLRHHDLQLGDLLRAPNDRDTFVEATVLTLVRDGESTHMPGGDTPLRVGDQLLLAGRRRGFSDLGSALFEDSTLEYVATGRQVATAFLWRHLAGQRYRQRGGQAHQAGRAHGEQTPGEQTQGERR